MTRGIGRECSHAITYLSAKLPSGTVHPLPTSPEQPNAFQPSLVRPGEEGRGRGVSERCAWVEREVLFLFTCGEAVRP